MGKYIKKLEAEVEKRREINTDYKAYSYDEMFKYKEQDMFSVLDFWQYAYSQLESNGSTIAEFLVAQALGIKKAENVNYWTAYDMSYRNKRIEVKATRYIHPWNTKISKTRTFSIEPTNNAYWGNGNDGVSRGKRLSRQSEVYVFCLNTNMDLKDKDMLRIEDWTFFVVPTYIINNYCSKSPNQKKISLNVVKKLAGHSLSFLEVKQYVDKAIEQSDEYYESL